jgi:hypothetical protein
MKQYSNLLPMQYVACNSSLLYQINLKGQSHETLDFRFFHESGSPNPRVFY